MDVVCVAQLELVLDNLNHFCRMLRQSILVNMIEKFNCSSVVHPELSLLMRGDVQRRDRVINLIAHEFVRLT